MLDTRAADIQAEVGADTQAAVAVAVVTMVADTTNRERVLFT
jgi:hypothetical protein